MSRKTLNDRIHFTYDKESKEILLEGNPITENQIAQIRTLVERHQIPIRSERYYYESAIYALANQRMTYEGSLALMKKLHPLADYDIKNELKIYRIAKERPYSIWWKENRVLAFYKYVQSNGGIFELVDKYIQSPMQVREELRKIKFWEYKTATLWYHTIGGKGPLLCIDVHNTIQSHGLGIEVPEHNYKTKDRGEGKKKTHQQLTGKRYLQVEKDLIDIFKNSTLAEKYPYDFLNEKGELNGAFVSALLWWQGTQGFRNNHASQLFLFEDQAIRFVNPYTPYKRSESKVAI